jgi:hypothetical protein
LVNTGYVVGGTSVGVRIGATVAEGDAVVAGIEIVLLCVEDGVGCKASGFRTSTLKVQPERKRIIAKRILVSFFLFIRSSLKAVLCLETPLIMRACRHRRMLALLDWRRFIV